jgi:REP element-mobilizing transposase RayT
VVKPQRCFHIGAIVILPEHLQRGIWQCRFWEHVIRDDFDYQQYVDYIHYNLVKHGWVTRVNDWQYSRFHCFIEQGIYTLARARVNWVDKPG